MDTIAQLYFGGDWACAHGDVDALAHIARELAARSDERTREKLAELEALCRSDPERASACWFALRRHEGCCDAPS